MQYNKLVRDKIPEIIKSKGKIPVVRFAGDSEYFEKLKQKLLEETSEFLEKEKEEELADILEAVYAICDYKKIKKSSLEKLRKKKAIERGAFKKRIILEKTK